MEYQNRLSQAEKEAERSLILLQSQSPEPAGEETTNTTSPRGPTPSAHRLIAVETLERSPHGTPKPSPRAPRSSADGHLGSKAGSLTAWAAETGEQISSPRDYGQAIFRQTSVPKPPSSPKYRAHTSESSAGPSSTAAMQKELEVMRAYTEKLKRELNLKTETVRRIEESLFESLVEKEQATAQAESARQQVLYLDKALGLRATPATQAP